MFERIKQAAYSVASMGDERRGEILEALADAVSKEKDVILTANREDIARMDKDNPLYDRLLLTPERLEAIAADIRHVAALPSPLGRTLLERTMPNGLEIKKISVPFGVVGVIYEARPNVTFDVFSLCMKSGNAVVLKGGKDAEASIRASVSLIHRVLREHGGDGDSVLLLPFTHDAAGAMLTAVGYIDLVIPRGGRKLIDYVRENAKVPCIETGAGVVNAYFDAAGDKDMGKAIILNAKTRRVSVCNALDCLIIHSSRLEDLPDIAGPLAERDVVLYADRMAYEALERHYPSSLLMPAEPGSFGTEYMDYKMSVKTVNCLEEALEHIRHYGSGHSECIITEDEAAAEAFLSKVDAACVYVNAPTSFTDGAQFGLGAEIGISTQKLGARGPMGLEELTTYKWLISGRGQIRE